MNAYIDLTLNIQGLFDKSNFDQVYVKDTINDKKNNRLIITLVYPVTYDLSRDIFDIIPQLEKQKSLLKFQNEYNKIIEILELNLKEN